MSNWKITFVLISILILTAAGCSPNPGPVEVDMPAGENQEEESEGADSPGSNEEGELPMTMALTSPSFNDGEEIPGKFTCDGEDISPELDWFGTPEGTVSLVLIMDDPDAPMGTWVHWVLFNLPMDLTGLREGMTGVGKDGTNSWNQTGYGGPCPPTGTHRYFFNLYALDTTLDLEPGAKKAAVLYAMRDHVLGEAELMGTYSR